MHSRVEGQVTDTGPTEHVAIGPNGGVVVACTANDGIFTMVPQVFINGTWVDWLNTAQAQPWAINGSGAYTFTGLPAGLGFRLNFTQVGNSADFGIHA